MNVAVWDMNEHVQALACSRQVVEVAALTDPGTLLGALAGRLRLKAERRNDHGAQSQSATAS